MQDSKPSLQSWFLQCLACTEVINIYSLGGQISQEKSFLSQFWVFMNLNKSVWLLDVIIICQLKSLAWIASSSGIYWPHSSGFSYWGHWVSVWSLGPWAHLEKEKKMMSELEHRGQFRKPNCLCIFLFSLPICLSLCLILALCLYVSIFSSLSHTYTYT